MIDGDNKGQDMSLYDELVDLGIIVPKGQGFQSVSDLEVKLNQPERSKREDSYWPIDHIWCGCPNCGDCSCKRCGALNTVVTQ